MEIDEPYDGDYATTLLGVLPVGLLLVQNGSISPAELAMGIILSLSIVGPLMKATTFINEAKSMEYAVEAANELLNLPVLPDSGKIVSIPHNDIALKHVTFSYDGSEQNEVLHDVNLELPEGSFTALVGPSGGGKSTIAPSDCKVLGRDRRQHYHWGEEYQRVVYTPAFRTGQFCDAG